MIRWWHGALAAMIAVALVGQTRGVLQADTGLVDLFSYFTIQSNILVLVASTLIALNPQRAGRAWRLLRLAGLVGITVTGVVYAVAIGPSVSFTGAAWWYDKAFHYVAPVMAIVGYFAFRPRATWQFADLAFIVWPISWLGYTVVRAEVGSPSFSAPQGAVSRYPYDFLDVDAHGWGAVVVACLLVTILLLGLAALFVRTGRSGGHVAT